MFENINNESFKEWFKKLRDKIAEEMADSPGNKDTERRQRSMLEQAGYEKLEELDHVIDMTEMMITAISHHKSVLIKAREKLLKELLDLFGTRRSPEPEYSPEKQEPDQPDAVPEEAPEAQSGDDHVLSPEDDKLRMDSHAPEQTPVPAPKKKSERKPRKKAEPEFKTLPQHPVTGNERRDRLESALHDALERLNNTKMAFHFRKVKMVRQALEELYKAAGGPDEERVTLLEAGLKDAVNMLSNSPSAASSKTMQDIWQNIIVALREVDDDDK